jgi:hypothetical protein
MIKDCKREMGFNEIPQSIINHDIYEGQTYWLERAVAEGLFIIHLYLEGGIHHVWKYDRQDKVWWKFGD